MSKSPPLTPLYERLPHGPHHIDRDEVIRIQMSRMLGAMLEAVRRFGYHRTSVANVLALAGTSRRAFYEQFDNKEDCFTKACEALYRRLVRKMGNACKASDGTFEGRVSAALGVLMREVERDPGGLLVLLSDAPSAGPGGIEVIHKMMGTFEQMVAYSFGQGTRLNPHGALVARGIVGGLARMTFVVVDGKSSETDELVDEMLQWVRLLDPAVVEHLGQASIAPDESDLIIPGVSARDESLGDRVRLSQAALEVLVTRGYADAKIPAFVADQAGIRTRRFFDLFEDGEECLQVALLEAGEDLLRVVSHHDLASADWPLAVSEAVRTLTYHLAANPPRAHAITAFMFEVNPALKMLSERVIDGLAKLLTQGAPAPSRSTFVLEAIKGAIGHIVSTFEECQKIEKLPLASDHIAYLVLAPLIGSQAAAREVQVRR